MNDPARLVLVGLGGYGGRYVEAVLDQGVELGVQLVGAVDPLPERCERRGEIEKIVGPIHRDLDSFYSAGEADLAVVSTPIHLHAPHTITAVEHGSPGFGRETSGGFTAGRSGDG